MKNKKKSKSSLSTRSKFFFTISSQNESKFVVTWGATIASCCFKLASFYSAFFFFLRFLFFKCDLLETYENILKHKTVYQCKITAKNFITFLCWIAQSYHELTFTASPYSIYICKKSVFFIVKSLKIFGFHGMNSWNNRKTIYSVGTFKFSPSFFFCHMI